GYGGPNSYFTGIDAAATSGIVNFIRPLAPGESTYFSLAGAIRSTRVDVNVVVFRKEGIVVGQYELRPTEGALTGVPRRMIAHTDILQFVVVNRDTRPQTFEIFGT